jgi:hypothetical protein
MTVLRIPQVDTDTLRDVVRDISRDVDMSRLTALRDDLGHLELPRADDLRTEFQRIERDLPSAGDLRTELQRIQRDLPNVGRFIGRPARRAGFVLPTITPTVVMASVALMAGAALGGVLAWLYQPGAGVKRRKLVRRRLHKLQRTIQHSR